MKKIIHLATCNTCQRIISEINPSSDVILQDIKTEPLTEEQVVAMKEMSGSYESLFSKRAQLYRKRGLNEQSLSEEDFKRVMALEYIVGPVLALMLGMKFTDIKAKEKDTQITELQTK